MKIKLLTISLSCCLVFLLFTQVSHAQHTKKMTFNAGEVTILHGIGAIIKGDDKGLIVEMIPPKQQRQKEYKDVDLLNQDKIIMCNGKKVKTIEDLNTVIENIEIGAEISFGIKRGKEMMIVSFPKADPKAGGQMMMMTMKVDDDGSGTETSIVKDGVEMKDVVMFEAGMILKDIDNKVNILAVLPDLASIVEGEKPQEGDIIISINGDNNLSSKEISKKYNGIKIGNTVSITLLRDSKEYKLSFKKPAVDDGGAEVIIEK